MRRRKRVNQYLGNGFYEVAGELYHLHEPEGYSKTSLTSVVGDLYTYRCNSCNAKLEKYRVPKPLTDPDWAVGRSRILWRW